VIWVDPKNIHLHVNKGLISRQKPHWIDRRPLGRLLRTVFQAEPFGVPATDYAAPKPILEMKTFKRIADLHDCWPDVKRSLWFRELCEEIERSGSGRHKHRRFFSSETAAAFLAEYGEDLLGSMARDGYVLRDGDDLPFCFIGAKGDIHKAHKGRHRLCAAKVLGIDRFPLLVVGMHEDFYSERVGKRVDLNRIREALRGVEAQAR
jgi:hypothetical protein